MLAKKMQNLTQLAENSLNSTAGQNLRENTRKYLIFSYWPKIGRKDFPRLMLAKNCKISLNWQKSPNSTDGQNLRENTRQHLIFSYWSKVERKYFPRLMLAKKLQNLTQLAENSSNSTAGQTLRQNTRT